MEKVECGCVTCVHNKRFNQYYGYCENPQNIVLKFRLAVNLDRGTIVMLECLNMELPENKEVA